MTRSQAWDITTPPGSWDKIRSLEPMRNGTALTFSLVHRSPLPILQSRALHWPDESACGETARALAGRAALGDALVELHGPLGAGKTTFVRHLLRALGVTGPVKSPTYTLMEPYEICREGRTLAVSHFDFYRLDDPQEWTDAGFRDVFANPGLKLVEWPQKAAELLPPADLRVVIEPEAEARSVRLEALTERGRELLP